MEQANLQADKPVNKPALVLHRKFPVAPEKVWRAWTDPQALKGRFGPGGPQAMSVADVDVRVGGRFRLVFGGADGNEHEAARDGHERGWTETFGKLDAFLRQA